MIKIDKSPFSITKYYGGYVRIGKEEYHFTLTIMSTGEDVTWIRTPKKHKELELDIIKQFYRK